MSEIDELMNLDPLHLSEQDLDKIIAYQRKQRQNFELGIKPKKEKGPTVSLDSVVASLTKHVIRPEPVITPGKRRV